MNKRFFAAVALTNLAFVLLTGGLAYQGHSFWKEQMQTFWHFGNCTPFFNHLGMWSDAVIISFLLPFIVWYWRSWKSYPWTMLVCFALATTFSVVANDTWAALSVDAPSCLALHGHHTLAGWAHIVYTIVVGTMVLAFYAASPGAIRCHWLIVTLVGYGHDLLAVGGNSWMQGDRPSSVVKNLIWPCSITTACFCYGYFRFWRKKKPSKTKTDPA